MGNLLRRRTTATSRKGNSSLPVVADSKSLDKAAGAGPQYNASAIAARVTFKATHDELLRRSRHNARLERASGYFYFFGGDAADWLDRTVRVATVNALTLDQWIDEFKGLKKVNVELMRGAKPQRKRS